MNTVVTLSFCSPGWHRSSIFRKCFCKSCQFVFASPCQYLPRLRSPGYTRNPCGALAYKMGKQMFGLLLLCQLVKLPTGRGQGVYMTWTWSADCGLKPNGHNIFCLVPKPINLLPPGQPQFFAKGRGICAECSRHIE